jgi:hypothetical protein
MSKQILAVCDDGRYFDCVDDWLEDLECNCVSLDDALLYGSDLVYEWRTTHPSFPSAGEIALECSSNAGKTPNAKHLVDSMLEGFYYDCDWYEGDDITGNLSLAELQCELYRFAEINQILWMVYGAIPHSWGVDAYLIAKRSLGLGRLQRALDKAEQMFKGHKLDYPKVFREATPMDMEIYPYLSKEMKLARALRVAREQNPDFDTLEYC